MTRPSLRTRWKAEALRTALVSDSVRTVLLLLSEHMAADGYVSVPRSKLAQALGRSPRRVTERLQIAVDAGLLARVSPGYEGHTAVYRALLPAPTGVRIAAPSQGADGRTPLGVRTGVPPVLKETSAFKYHLRSEPRAVNPAATAAVLFASLPALQAATSTRPETNGKRRGAGAMSTPGDQDREDRSA